MLDLFFKYFTGGKLKVHFTYIFKAHITMWDRWLIKATCSLWKVSFGPTFWCQDHLLTVIPSVPQSFMYNNAMISFSFVLMSNCASSHLAAWALPLMRNAQLGAKVDGKLCLAQKQLISDCFNRTVVSQRVLGNKPATFKSACKKKKIS